MAALNYAIKAALVIAFTIAIVFPPEVLEQKVAYWNKVNSGEVFLDRWASVTTDLFVAGMELSVCRGCMAVQIWAGGQLIQR